MIITMPDEGGCNDNLVCLFVYYVSIVIFVWRTVQDLDTV